MLFWFRWGKKTTHKQKNPNRCLPLSAGTLTLSSREQPLPSVLTPLSPSYRKSVRPAITLSNVVFQSAFHRKQRMPKQIHEDWNCILFVPSEHNLNIMSDRNQPSLPNPLKKKFKLFFCSCVCFCLMAISTVFHCINSPSNSPYESFQLYISLWKSPSALI